MKWFKHDTDTSDDIKIKRLEEEFKNDGYATFFKILEIIGKEGEKFRLSLEKYPKKWISDKCHISEETLTKILESMGKIGLLCRKSLSNNILYIPNFRRRADDYTKRLRRNSELSTDNVHVDKNRIDKNKIDKIIDIYITTKSIKTTNEDGSKNQSLITYLYKRNGKIIKELLTVGEGKVENIIEWIKEVGEICGKKGLQWSLETVLRWKAEGFIREDTTYHRLQKKFGLKGEGDGRK